MLARSNEICEIKVNEEGKYLLSSNFNPFAPHYYLQSYVHRSVNSKSSFSMIRDFRPMQQPEHYLQIRLLASITGKHTRNTLKTIGDEYCKI